MLIKSKISYKTNIIAIVNILSTSNNTIINISQTHNNNTILSGSSGLFGMKGSRRSTSYAAQVVVNIFGKKLMLLGIKYLYLKLKGFGNGRYSSIKSLSSLMNLKILNIIDLTPIPFNGCKPSKKRRV
jgi:small subunit ribosomal protein S11